MDYRYLLFLFFFIFIFKSEGFINIYNQNLNRTNGPDSTQFYPIANHTPLNYREYSGISLGNNNYKLLKNSIKEPGTGPYSAFLDTQKIRRYDHFFHAPIADDIHTKDTSYDKYFEYDIIYADKLNKSDLLKREKFNDTFIHNPYYLYGHPENNSKILYNDRLQELFLKHKNETNRYENVSHSGDGFHGI